MASRPRSLSQKSNVTPGLLDALKFISLAQSDKGAPHQTHCVLHDNWARAFNGVIAVGQQIDETISFCPHTLRFIEALKRCTDSYALSQLETRIAIKAGPFSCSVPTLLREQLPDPMPDPPEVQITDAVRESIETVSGLVADNAQHIVTAAILLRSGSAVATDRLFMMESWHGQLLPSLRLPKAAGVALSKAGKGLTAFGFGGKTATFYFIDGSWLRTQLYEEEYPDVDRILDRQFNPFPIPPDFFQAVRAIAPFNDGTVIFEDGMLRSHSTDTEGAEYKISGLPKGLRYKAKYLLAAEPYALRFDFQGVDSVGCFVGEKVRGIITQQGLSFEEQARQLREASVTQTQAINKELPPCEACNGAGAIISPSGFIKCTECGGDGLQIPF